MLERTVVYVDTSYLLASFYNSWEIGARAQLEIDLPEVVAILDGMISNQLGQRVHRQNWYDGIPDTGPHRYQRALRTCEGVQLRTGQLIEWGERRTQKAVDTRLVADMVTTACKQQFTDMVLVSGDADMIPGVQEATNAGIRVHLYGFGWDSMSAALRHACDTTTILDPREDFTGAMELQVLEGPLPPTVRETQCATPEADDAKSETGTDAEPGSAQPSAHETEPKACVSTTSASTTGESTTPETAGAGTTAKASEPGTSDTATDRAASIAPGVPASSSAATSTGSPKLPDNKHSASASGAKPGENLRKPDSDEFADAVAPAPKPSEVSTAKDAPVASDDVAPTPPTTPGGDNSAPKISPAAPTTQPETAPGEQLDDDNDPSEVEAELHAQSRATPGTHQAESRADAKNNEGTQPAAPASSPKPATPRPSPSMMAPRRKLRSRYVPLPEEVWTSAGFQTPYDVGQQYARWWYDNAASTEQRDQAHLLSGGGLPPEVDRPLLQFACETLHEYTLSESQRVKLRDGFHSGIRGVLLNAARDN